MNIDSKDQKVMPMDYTKLEQAARQALGALVRAEAMYGQPNADIQTALREALAEQAEQSQLADASLEPVYAFRRKGQDSFCTCDKERYEELADKPNLFEVTTFYAAPVQQAEQEPVAWATKISKAFFNSPANGVFQVSHIMRDEYNVPLYTPPVDAKAIRAEALEEAAKFAYDLRFRCCWTAEAIAAAIRGMK